MKRITPLSAKQCEDTGLASSSLAYVSHICFSKDNRKSPGLQNHGTLVQVQSEVLSGVILLEECLSDTEVRVVRFHYSRLYAYSLMEKACGFYPHNEGSTPSRHTVNSIYLVNISEFTRV